MTTYQDVVASDLPIDAWALSESSGTAFSPYAGVDNLTGSAGLAYNQPGPFTGANGLHIPAAGTLRTPTFISLVQPLTIEAWVKLDATPPGTLTLIFYWGNSSANGSGLYVATNGHVHLYNGGVADIDTGFTVSSGWHLYQLGNATTTDNRTIVAVDGVVIYNATPAAPATGNPQQFGFLCSATAAAATAGTVAMPALYPNTFGYAQAYSHFLASSSPDQALGYTRYPGASGGDSLLLQILNSVRKTY